VQIAKLLFVLLHDLEIEQRGFSGAGTFRQVLAEFQAAAAHERDFESGDAIEAPADIGNGFRSTGWSLLRKHGLHEGAFFGTDRFELRFIIADVGLVKNGVVRREKNGLASESGLDGIEADGGKTFGRARAGGFERVRSLSIELSLRDGLGFGLERFGSGGLERSVFFTSGFEGLALSGAADGTSRHNDELLW